MTGPGASSPTADACTSCGRDDEPLHAVHRIYVTPEAWDTPGRADVQDEVEHWCFACRTQYPHEDA
ncbi:MAG: hypothetical protein KDB10_10640 [Acidimicrobiales bacterium]|nr:hypothetical protein [Acidimicrobiales bacterium]MCB9372404.1 hypothetical protein [Microthrixaceae bacterium]